jgi:hypothetical protein
LEEKTAQRLALPIALAAFYEQRNVLSEHLNGCSWTPLVNDVNIPIRSRMMPLRYAWYVTLLDILKFMFGADDLVLDVIREHPLSLWKAWFDDLQQNTLVWTLVQQSAVVDPFAKKCRRLFMFPQNSIPYGHPWHYDAMLHYLTCRVIRTYWHQWVSERYGTEEKFVLNAKHGVRWFQEGIGKMLCSNLLMKNNFLFMLTRYTLGAKDYDNQEKQTESITLR